MIFTLVILLSIIVFLAFFVGKNLTNTCTLWLFKTYSDLPVSTLVFISFAAGIVISILCIIIYKLKQSEPPAKKDNQKQKSKKAEKAKAYGLNLKQEK